MPRTYFIRVGQYPYTLLENNPIAYYDQGVLGFSHLL